MFTLSASNNKPASRPSSSPSPAPSDRVIEPFSISSLPIPANLHQVAPGTEPRTSQTHPINISWLFPQELIAQTFAPLPPFPLVRQSSGKKLANSRPRSPNPTSDANTTKTSTDSTNGEDSRKELKKRTVSFTSIGESTMDWQSDQPKERPKTPERSLSVPPTAAPTFPDSPSTVKRAMRDSQKGLSSPRSESQDLLLAQLEKNQLLQSVKKTSLSALGSESALVQGSDNVANYIALKESWSKTNLTSTSNDIVAPPAASVSTIALDDSQQLQQQPGPKDMLDMLGIPESSYPTGRAPSSSGFVGGFPVGRVAGQTNNTANNNANLLYTTSANTQGTPKGNSPSQSTSVSRPRTPQPDIPGLGVSFSSNLVSAMHASSKLNYTTAGTQDPESVKVITQIFPPPVAPVGAAKLIPEEIFKSLLLPSQFAALSMAQLTGIASESVVAGSGKSGKIGGGGDTVEMDDEERKVGASTGGREEIEAMEAGLKPEVDFTGHIMDGVDNRGNEAVFVSVGKLGASGTGIGKKKPHGNIALSSCPGKKVRLNTGPVNGRASINRDLDDDFERLASFQIRTVVCCISDTELNYLGAPWPKYLATAHKYGMDIIRLPIAEGSCPDSMEDVEVIMDVLERRISEGSNVLVHCRGGVGRAGLIACCFLIRRQYVLSAERAIQFVRLRRVSYDQFRVMDQLFALKSSSFAEFCPIHTELESYRDGSARGFRDAILPLARAETSIFGCKG
ncbi:hypothetical protein HDU76_001663 [Blyttiomyces sp. JEL0837]|nr:hypothetical protein HDU76_001663 [Blyttiomyces sp. JEL0837]